jgi:hypothetical protein
VTTVFFPKGRATVSSGARAVPGGARAGFLTVVVLTLALAAAFLPGNSAQSAVAAGARSLSVAPPATRADAGSGQGSGPPTDPSTNIAPSPNFLNSCPGNSLANTSACVSTTLQAINNARQQEGLPGMVLPTDWAQLSAEQQLFAATNLERTARGLPALSGMASALDQVAETAATQNADPSPPAGFRWSSWGGNWAGAIGNPLEAVYFWMYDDGPGSYNIDCTPSNSSGCWGHRNNILLSLRCQPCLMGAGFNATAYRGNPSWTALLVDTTGTATLDFTWGQVLADLPGSSSTVGLSASAVGIASTPHGQGYWLAAADGGLFAFGDAGFYGSMGGRPLAQKVVGIASTPDGQGYWEVAADGGLFAFGDAGFYGSMGGTTLFRPVVSMASTPDGRGYWEVASDGGIFAFGDASFRGSTGGHALVAPIVSMTAPSSTGYWLAASDGGIFSFGLPFHGSMA